MGDRLGISDVVSIVMQVGITSGWECRIQIRYADLGASPFGRSWSGTWSPNRQGSSPFPNPMNLCLTWPSQALKKNIDRLEFPETDSILPGPRIELAMDKFSNTHTQDRQKENLCCHDELNKGKHQTFLVDGVFDVGYLYGDKCVCVCAPASACVCVCACFLKINRHCNLFWNSVRKVTKV